MTYNDAIQYLYGLTQFGTKLGLENTLRLAELVGNPHRKLRFIHVAGTNGKGSTCAMLESIYRRSGLRVGLFTSPHLVSFRERIQINRRSVATDEIARRIADLREIVQKHFTGTDNGAGAGVPTFFECVTVLALLCFDHAQCDLVVWETGMGGRLDATNIVTPLASVITNIGLDHQMWLGSSIEDITFEKAGIIKHGIPVVSAASQPEAVLLLRQIAAERSAPIHIVGGQATSNEDPSRDYPTEQLKLPLLGNHQRTNAALAAATVRVLEDTLPVSRQDVARGLESISWGGRLQTVDRAEGPFILDGAHNRDAAIELAKTLNQITRPDTVRTMILGILQDKDVDGITAALAGCADRIEIVPVQSQRSANPDVVAESCRGANPRAAIRKHASLEQAIETTRSDPHIVVTGSLYLIGEAMALLGLNPNALDEARDGLAYPDERGLNEWGKL